MATPTKITKVGAVFKPGKDKDGNEVALPDANEDIWVSPPHVLSQPKPKPPEKSNTSINLTLPSDAKAAANTRVVYVTTYNPKTKITAVYEQEYESILGVPTRTPKLLDPDKRIATRNEKDGTYEPTKYAKENYTSSTVSNIANNAATRADIERTRAYTYQNGYQQINKKPPSPVQVATALQDPLPVADPDAIPLPGAEDDDGSTIRGASLSSIDINDVQTASEVASGLSDDLKYPSNSPTYLESDYVRFSAIKYKPAEVSSNSFAISYNPGEVIGASVYLPIQGGISDSNGVGWNEEVINPLQIAGAQIALETLDGGGGGLAKAVSRVVGNVADNAPEVISAIKASVTESAIGANILPRTSRAIFNPNTELLFNGPQLRAFTFSFKLMPRSDNEAKEIKKIIRFFKVNMAARTTESALFLKAPNVFRIEYIHKDEGANSHPGINLIKDCALQNFSVDYTPDGTYMTVGDDDIGAMFSYNLTMSFMELTPVYSKDYDDENAGDHPIGY
jgi:hypothetical protein